MHYLLNRVRALLQQLMTLRGALIGAVVIAWLLALLTPSPTQEIFALLGLVALATLLLIISARQAATHDALENTTQETQRAAAHAEPIIGPNADTRRELRLTTARAQIAAARQSLAINRDRLQQLPPPERLAPEMDEGLAPPTVTVVVPCYNEARYVADTLESVRSQSFTDWECIVVDDASTDRSLAEIWRYIGIDSRFRLIRHKENSGLSASRNTGLRAARGRFITFLDADDLLMSDSLVDRVGFLVERGAPDLAGVYGGVRISDESVALADLPDSEPGAKTLVLDFVSSGGECPFNAHAPLLRTEVVRRAGGFNERMRFGAEDWDLWYRIMRNGYQFVGTGTYGAVYRQKQRSMAKAHAVEHIGEARRLTGLAYHDVDPEILWDSGLVAYDRPLSEYERRITISSRIIQYAATAMIDSGADTARRTLANLEPLPPGAFTAHVEPEQRIDDGFRRALGLAPAEYKEVSRELEPVKRRLLVEIRELVDSPKTVEPEMRPVRCDVLFAPQTLDQARTMLQINRALDKSRTSAFLLTERISGVQGAGAVLEEAGSPVLTLDEVALQADEATLLVVAFPRDGALDEAAAAFAEGGGAVISIERPEDEVLMVDDTPRYDTPMTGVSIEDAPGLIEDALRRETPSIAIGRPWSIGPMVWVGVTAEDPDQTYTLEEYPDTTFDADRLREFKDIHRGRRCVIIGNGPSLNDIDLTKLAPEFTIAVNGIFYAADEMGFDPTYYVVEDTAVMRDNLEAIREYRAGQKFFPSIYRNQVGTAENVAYFMMNRGYYQSTSPSYCVPRFSTDITQRVFSGQSVTIINLQLAYYLGFEEVVLIGMDFSYTIPADSIVEGNRVLSQGDDPNHFHPEYFGKGKVWKDPKLDRVLANYQLAKLIYEADGRRIINATPGGKLELFDRIPYDELFSGSDFSADPIQR